jgi:hypothetical protein
MRLFLPVILSFAFIAGSAIGVYAQKRAQRTSGARAAYGNSVPFKSHVKKNKRSKKKARKAAEKKKLRNKEKPYRRGMPI